MRLTATQLRRIIREETQRVLEGAEPERGVEKAIALISDGSNTLAGAVGELRYSQENAASDHASGVSQALQDQIDVLTGISKDLGTVMDELDKLKGLY